MFWQEAKESDIKSKYALNNLKHQANINIIFEPLSRLFIQFQTTYKDRLGYYNGYDFDADAYTEYPYEDYWMLNTKISYQINNYKLHIEISNLSNVHIVEFGVPQPGMWIIVGMKYQISI